MIYNAGRYIRLILFFLVFLTVGGLLLTFRTINTHKQSDQLITHTYTVIDTMDNFILNLMQADSYHKRYLLTGDQTYLNEFTKSKNNASKMLTTLQALTKDNPSQQQRFIQMKQPLKERYDIWQQTVTIYDTEGLPSVQAALASKQGIGKMTQVYQYTDAIQKQEYSLLNERKTQSANDLAVIYGTITMSSLIDLILICLIYFLITKELSFRNLQDQRKDEFINLASHELKTPITSQKVYAQLLRKELVRHKNPKVLRYIDQIDDQTQKLVALITDMLDMSRIQLGKLNLQKSPFELSQLIADTIEAIQGTTQKHTIKFRNKAKTMVMADRYRIYQVLVNLLTNAIKYSPSGGDIIVRLKKNKQIIVSVKDYGLGIAKEHQERIFDRLYQVSEGKPSSIQGLGIGLYISCQIIKEHGGDIWVESEEGNGSTFYFSLPPYQPRKREKVKALLLHSSQRRA